MKRRIATGPTPAIAVLMFFVAGCASGARNVTTRVPAGTRAETITITVREGSGLAFDLSPDGRQIVFDLLGQLWLLPVDGGAARQLTNAVADTAEDRGPVVSPDGRLIVFEADRPAGRGLWLVPMAGGAPTPVGPPGTTSDAMSPSWAPDGDRIAFVRNAAIHVLELSAGQVRTLRIEGLPARFVRDPAWSPDGAHVAFVNAHPTAPAGGRVWEVPADGGTAAPITAEGVAALGPTYSPEGRHIAFLAPDSAGSMQVWVQDRAGGSPRRATDSRDVTSGSAQWSQLGSRGSAPHRPRWSNDGARLYYAADGGLWHVASDGGVAQEIAFTARLSLVRSAPALRPPAFAAPGTVRTARGHMGLALSPDACRIALIALGRLWVLPIGGTPHAVAAVPQTAAGLAWSPDARELAWSAGPGGGEDLFATDVETAATRRLTALPGRAVRPSWSPDGRHIAFLHWDPPALNAPMRVRVMPSRGEPVERVEETIGVGEVDFMWKFEAFPLGQEVPQWSPDSDALLLFDSPPDGSPASAALAPLASPAERPRRLTHFPRTASFVHWSLDSSLVYVADNALWRAVFTSDSGIVGEPARLSDDAALYPSVAADGSVLYVSSDGLRLRRPGGQVERLGWPLDYRTAAAPAPMLIRNVRLFDGTGNGSTAPRDVLVENRRIARITAHGDLQPPSGASVLDAGGRHAIPGLIDAHAHLQDDARLPGTLYHGVTTVRDVGSAIARTAALRDEVDAGLRSGPRILFGGFQFHPGAFGKSGAQVQLPSDRRASERGIALAQGFGATHVKMYRPSTLVAGVELIEAAHASGMPVGGHIAAPLPLVAAGMNGMEHTGGRLYGDVAELLGAAGMWVVPTLAVRAAMLRLLDEPGLYDQPGTAEFVTPFLRQWGSVAPASRARLESGDLAERESVLRLHRANVPIAAGADVRALPWALHLELEELVRSGLSPLEAIAAATSVAARILGAYHEFGTIEEGKWADLLILDADPLEDIRNTRRIWRVIQGGRVVERDALIPSES